MREKKDLILDVLTGIDEVLLQKNLEKRYTLWQKPKRRRSPLIISLISAAACILLLVTGLFAFMRTPDDVPVYHGMTISKEDEIKPSDTAQTAGISGTAALRSPFLYAPKKAVFPARMIYGGPEDKKPDKDLPVFGQNYYAMPGEDIYINIHLSNPGGYEILSFTLNGVKYSSYMFEPGSDLETLILKTNVGETGGLKEYTIDAIKYVDGERIKDVKMKGDRTVKVFVNDDSGFLQLETEIDGLTLNVRTLWADTFTGEKKLLSLALYEDDVLYKELAPDASFVNGLPLGKRFVLRAEYLDQGMPQTVNHVFTMPKESEGLVISNGLITGIGTCSDTVLYLDHPIAEKFLYEQPHLRIQEVYMTDNVTSIGESAFRGCKYLTKVRLSRSLTAIPDNAFKACILLKEIIIPNSITSIGECAFANCGITSIHIPISVVEMKRSVFALNNFETPSKEYLTIYCAAKSKPAGWDENWGSPHTNPSEFENGAKYPVIWNTKYTEDPETCKHRIVIDNAVPATCMVDGQTEGSHCDKRGKVFTVQQSVAALGHQLDDSYTCTRCGATMTETDIALLHIMETAPRVPVTFYNAPFMEIWNNNLQLLIEVSKELGENQEDQKDFRFELYYRTKDSDHYKVVSLKAWSIVGIANIVHRIKFYDTLYPDMAVGAEYDVKIVLYNDVTLIGWAQDSLVWIQEYEDLVQQAINNKNISK